MTVSQRDLDAAAEALCSIDSGQRVLMRPLFQAAQTASLRLALADLPAPGYALITANLLSGAEEPGHGAFSSTVLPQEHVLCRLMAGGARLLTPADPGSNTLAAELRELGSSPHCTLLLATILPPPGGTPPLGALLLELPPEEDASSGDVQACLQLARALGERPRHREALRRLAGRLTEQLAPLGIRSARELEGGGDGYLSDPSMPSDFEEGWESEGDGWERAARSRPGAASPGVASSAAARAAGAAGNQPPSFRQHWNHDKVSTDRFVLLFALVFNAVKARRLFELAGHRPWSRAWLLAYWAGLAATLYCALRWPRRYAAWRELPAALLPAAAVYLPVNWEVAMKPLADAGLWERRPLLGLLLFWAAINYSCMLPASVLLALGWPKRFVIQCIAQAAYIARALWGVLDICATPLLRQPASQRQLAAVHGALQASAAALGLQLPAAGPEGGPDSELGPELECHVILSTAMLLLGYAVPVALSAVLERRSYLAWRRRFAAAAAAAGGGAGRSAASAAPTARSFAAAPARQSRPGQGLLRGVLEVAWQAARQTLLAAGAGALALAVWLGCAAAYSREVGG